MCPRNSVGTVCKILTNYAVSMWLQSIVASLAYQHLYVLHGKMLRTFVQQPVRASTQNFS